jgi:branched-chain amino acid transport system substrate-binding protein
MEELAYAPSALWVMLHHFRVATAGLAVALVAGNVPAGAQSAPPLKIGLIFSFTGGTATAAKSNDAILQAFFKTHGDTVAGRKVQIITRDDTGIAPEVARRLAQELIVQDHVDIIVGTNLTPNAVAVTKVSTQAKVPFFIVNSATSNVLKDQPYSARFGFTTEQIVPPLAVYAAKNYGKTAFSIFQNYGPGIDADKAFERTFTENGGTMIGNAPIPVNNQDFSAYIQRVKEAKPAVLFVFLNAAGGGVELLHEITNQGLIKAGVKVVATGDIVNGFLLPALQSSNPPLGLVTVFNYSRTHPSATNKAFVAAFHAAYGDQINGPDFNSVAEWDAMQAVYMVANALKGDFSNPERVMSIVKGMKIDSPRGPLMIDPSTRDAVENVYLRRLEMVDGRLENTEFDTTPMVKDPTETY